MEAVPYFPISGEIVLIGEGRRLLPAGRQCQRFQRTVIIVGISEGWRGDRAIRGGGGQHVAQHIATGGTYAGGEGTGPVRHGNSLARFF